MRRPIEQDAIARRLIERALTCKRLSNQWLAELEEVHPVEQSGTWQAKFALGEEYLGKYRILVWAAKIASGTLS